MLTDLRARLSTAACVFLDCDGVIFDANSFKLKALQVILQDYPPETHPAMESYWSGSGGISRYVKFDRYFREMLGMSGDAAQAAIARALTTFAQLSREGYARELPVSAAVEFARRLGPDRVVVVSGSDEKELHQIFRAHGLTGVFQRVLGSPETKTAHVRRELAVRGHSASACLFVGDGPADLEAAQAVGMPFVFLAEMSDWLHATDAIEGALGAYYVQSWSELLGKLEACKLQSNSKDARGKSL